MKFLPILLLAEAALGAHLTHQRRENHAKHAQGLVRQSRPKQVNGVTDILETEYSDNWAGGVITSTDITAVNGTIVVPKVTAPADGTASKRYSASAWVGIDGYTCTTAIVQTGVDFCVEAGNLSFSSWFEWYPNYAYDFSMAISEGDVIEMSVTATTNTTGSVMLDNLTTGKTVSHEFTGNVQGDLCRTNAEWIVEDYEESSSLVSFADFGNFTFTHARAVVKGETVGPKSGSVMEMKQDDTLLTSCSVTTDEVNCVYN
ncbi:putative aspergillopepsin [Coniella lustricola]|uniref:Putative aspergillopepsin n=1 Tax=Coniella lustricola TaxID=2025994 RepID=A0A2T2ZSN7_9PEZI|nr:putative aspergillopepsin [Coniella lustricola]